MKEDSTSKRLESQFPLLCLHQNWKPVSWGGNENRWDDKIWHFVKFGRQKNCPKSLFRAQKCKSSPEKNGQKSFVSIKSGRFFFLRSVLFPYYFANSDRKKLRPFLLFFVLSSSFKETRIEKQKESFSFFSQRPIVRSKSFFSFLWKIRRREKLKRQTKIFSYFSNSFLFNSRLRYLSLVSCNLF